MVQVRQKPCRKRHDNPMHSAGIIDQARDVIALAAGPRGWDDTRESWLARGARRLSWSYARVRKVWYRRIDDLWASEWLSLQAKAEEIRRQLQETEAANARLRLALDSSALRSVEGAPAAGEGDAGNGAGDLVDGGREAGARPGAVAAVRLGKVGE